jgi:hypothetical protein
VGSDVVVVRIDTVEVRPQQTKEIMNSFVCYMRLEKIEIGGPKGEQLSYHLLAIYNEIMAQFDHFQRATYDAFDPEDHEFSHDAATYKDKSKN